MLSRSATASMMTATTPIGTLIQNTSGHANCVTRTAPSPGPTIAAKPQTLESQPWMRARSAGV